MDRLVYSGEHLSGNRHESCEALVKYTIHPKGFNWQDSLKQIEIILVIEGSFSLSYEEFFDRKVIKGEMILLPPGCQYKANTKEGVSFFVFRMNRIEHFCDSFSLERLSSEEIDNDNDISVLEMKPIMENYLLTFKDHYQQGLRCSMYNEIKIREFFFLLRAYYTKEDLAGFFKPLLSNNTRFMSFVLQNYRQISRVREFATLYNCSVSNFEKKFRNTFGMSPYKWMMQKRISLLYNEINTTDKPLGQIAREQNFSSLPQFTDYCKKHFGFSPGKMRRLARMDYFIR